MRVYLFDLDGTLTDARAGLNLSFRAALAALGLPDMDDDAAGAFLGSPLPEAFRSLDPRLAAADVERGMAAFRAAYEREGLAQHVLYPGVDEMLAAIGRRGARSLVVTSKPEPYANRVVDLLGIRGSISAVIGPGLDEADNKTVLIARALALAGARPGEALMLGDRRYDVEGAIANGVLPVGALWGYGGFEELHAAGCRDFARSANEFRERFVDGMDNAVG